MIMKKSGGRITTDVREYRWSRESKSSCKTTDSKEVTGVLVVCEGGDDKNLVAYITDAINGLLGVPVHKIKVMKMSE